MKKQPQKRNMMLKSVALAILCLIPFSPQLLHAQSTNRFRFNIKSTAPAAWYRLKSIDFDVNSCLNIAEQALKKTVENDPNHIVFDIKRGNGSPEVGGVTLTTRAYIVCIERPNAGACNGDGSTAVITGAGPDAKEITKNLYDNLPDLVPIDCGSAGNGI